MNRWFYWFCLLAGAALLVVGVKSFYFKNEWTLLVLSMLIIAFSISGILRKRPNPPRGS
jgi:uncharacterized membrane protein HdeD (DUF308 family)